MAASPFTVTPDFLVKIRSRTAAAAAGRTLAALALLALAGCRAVDSTTKMPMEAIMTVLPTGKSGQPDPAALQVAVMRYADDYFGRTVTAIDEYAAQINTEEGRRNASKWKLAVSATVVSVATGPNPTANLIDFVALTTLTRSMLEDRSSNFATGAAFQAWLETSRVLETNAWRLAQATFKPNQLQELHAAIQKWRENNPGGENIFLTRPQEMAGLIHQTDEKSSSSPGGVFSLIGLDATAALDPAVREVTRTRLFAERAMFMAQRLPFLLRWQIEVLADQILHDNEVHLALTNALRLAESADRFSRATESASQTAAQLPDRITAERKAVLAALETQEGKLQNLSSELARTLGAGEKMSTSLNTTLTTFDALMKRFGVGEPSTNPAPSTASSPAPFNILDYARTAEQLSIMAKELDGLLKSADASLDSPALNKRLQDLRAAAAQARGEARSLLHHAFLLGAGLIVLAFVCALLYRRTAGGKKSTSAES